MLDLASGVIVQVTGQLVTLSVEHLVWGAQALRRLSVRFSGGFDDCDICPPTGACVCFAICLSFMCKLPSPPLRS